MLLNYHSNSNQWNIRKDLNQFVEEERLKNADEDKENDSAYYLMKQKTITILEKPKISFLFPSNREKSIDITFRYQSIVHPGQQLFVDYGGDGSEWFQDRELDIQDMTPYEIDYANPLAYAWLEPSGKKKKSQLAKQAAKFPRLPGCIQSYAIRWGELLYARRPIAAGTILEISKAILIDGDLLERYLPTGLNRPLEDMLWWEELVEGESEVSPSGGSAAGQQYSRGYMLSGYGPFYSHSRASLSGAASANVRFRRWSASTEQQQVLVAFEAVRDISEGEELVLTNVFLSEKDVVSRRRLVSPGSLVA